MLSTKVVSLRLSIFFFGIYCFLFLARSTCYSQVILPLVSDSVAVEKKQDYFGAGVNAVIGDATLLQVIPAFHFTYRHSFSDSWSGEISYSYTGEAALQVMETAGQFAYMFTEISKGSMGGLTVYYVPDEHWSFGLGATVRHRVYAYFIARYPFLQDTWTQYLLDYSLGLQVSAEYKLITLSPIEIFLNGHFAYFSPSIAGDAFIGNQDFYNFPANPTIKPTGYSGTVANYFRLPIQSLPFMASIGLCFRVGF